VELKARASAAEKLHEEAEPAEAIAAVDREEARSSVYRESQ
jgi:hypothetical protein